MYEIDRLASQLSHDKLGFLRRVRLCPSCGTRRLQRHERVLDPFNKPIQGTEYWCLLCGFSFNIRMSVEWGVAVRLFGTMRKLRNTKGFNEAQFDPAAVAAWKEKYDRPVFKPQSTWSLADKLKEALGI